MSVRLADVPLGSFLLVSERSSFLTEEAALVDPLEPISPRFLLELSSPPWMLAE